MRFRFLLALLLLSLTGCVTPPSAQPVAVAHGMLHVDDKRELGYRLVWPRGGSRLPLVVFSHGAYSSGDDYNPILDAWAARGYVVVSVTHRDSVSLGVKRGTSEPRYFGWRLDDMEALLAHLPEALDAAPAQARLRARTDTKHIAAAGHSFGGLVAQSLGGASYFDAQAQITRLRADPRVRAVLILSGAGPFAPTVREEDFARLQVPTLVSVGTNDLAQAPGMSGEQWRRLPFDLAAPGHKFRLTLRGADHYFGGSVGRDDLPRSPNANDYLRIYAEISGNFLDAYLRGDAHAASRLSNRAGVAGARELEPLATLEQR